MERTRSRAGFTLVELMVVVVILGIIGTISFMYIIHKPDEARWEAARQEMTEISKALDLYRLDHGVYPDSLADLPDINREKVVNPFNGQAFEYERGGDGTSYKLKFLGKDGREGESPVPDKDLIITERG